MRLDAGRALAFARLLRAGGRRPFRLRFLQQPGNGRFRHRSSHAARAAVCIRPAAVGLPQYDSRPHNRSLTVEKADCRDQPGLHSLPDGNSLLCGAL